MDRFIKRQNKAIDVIPDEIRRKVEELCEGRVSYYSWLVMDKSGICEEIYGVKTVKGKPVVQKIAVVSEQFGFDPIFRNCYIGGINGNGFFSYGYDGKGRTVQYTWFAYEDRFWPGYMDNYRRCSKTELFDMARIVELDPGLKYCSWYKGCGLGFIEYLRLYRLYPSTVEFISKLGLKRLLNENAISEISKDIGLAKWISRHSQQVKGMAFRTIRNAYHKNPNADPRDYETSLLYRIESGKACALRNKALYAKVLKHTTQERIAKYLKDNRIDKSSYSDYLEACDWLKLDLSDTKVLFPHDFVTLHHEYTTQYARDMAQRELDKTKSHDIRMASMAERFSYVGDYRSDGLCVVIARSKMDLIDEGAYLHHCVGKMHYDQRQANGESLICFIRKESEPAIPFVTAEVKIAEKRLRVAQCYGDHNRIVDEVQPFVERWMRNSNKQLLKGMPIRA